MKYIKPQDCILILNSTFLDLSINIYSGIYPNELNDYISTITLQLNINNCIFNNYHNNRVFYFTTNNQLWITKYYNAFK